MNKERVFTELLRWFDPDTNVVYVGEIWGRERVESTLQDLVNDVIDLFGLEATEGLEARIAINPGEPLIVDEVGNAVVILEGE